jgi:hypothetical protein
LDGQVAPGANSRYGRAASMPNAASAARDRAEASRATGEPRPAQVPVRTTTAGAAPRHRAESSPVRRRRAEGRILLRRGRRQGAWRRRCQPRSPPMLGAPVSGVGRLRWFEEVHGQVSGVAQIAIAPGVVAARAVAGAVGRAAAPAPRPAPARAAAAGGSPTNRARPAIRRGSQAQVQCRAVAPRARRSTSPLPRNEAADQTRRAACRRGQVTPSPPAGSADGPQIRHDRHAPGGSNRGRQAALPVRQRPDWRAAPAARRRSCRHHPARAGSQAKCRAAACSRPDAPAGRQRPGVRAVVDAVEYTPSAASRASTCCTAANSSRE